MATRREIAGARELGMVQLLTPEGQRVDDADYPLDISDDEIAALYRDLTLVRTIDREAIALQRQGELGLWTSLLGQEAAQIGAGRALARDDMVFPSYREHGVAWCRGMDPLELLDLWRGSSAGGWDPHRHNFGMYTIVIGAQTLHAVGYAMGVVRDKATTQTAVLTFFGDGAMSQGDVSEAFGWAAASNLPVVFFCQNNQWAISAPVRVQTTTPLYRRAAGFGFPGVRVDGNDVLASLAVTRAALEHARRGGGPTLIEAFTYRMNPHTTSDDDTRYRARTEVEHWTRRDPIARVRCYLEREAGVGAQFFADIDAEAEALAQCVRSGGRARPEPTIAALFANVYLDTPADLIRQQRDLEASQVDGVSVPLRL